MIGRQEQERPMAVASLNPGYAGPTRDKLENFHGAQLIYVHWEEHLNFCAAITLPLPPATPFGALTSEILPSLYAADPEWASGDLSAARWLPAATDSTGRASGRGRGRQEV